MSVSKYEAAALYHYVSQGIETEEKYLIIDLDDCSFGYCECGNGNRTRLNHSSTSTKTNLWDEFLQAVKNLVEKDYPYDINAEIQAQLAIADSSFQSYYLSERAINGEAFVFSNITLTCEDVERELLFTRGKVEGLVSQIKNQLSEDKLMGVSIIVLGKAQKVNPVMYFLREFLSFDPLLPDSRFKNDQLQDDYSEIVRMGQEYLAALKALKYSYSLMGFDAIRNSEIPIWSVEKGQQEMEINKMQFSPPIMVFRGDKLLIKRDSTNLEIAMPYSFAPMDSDLVEISFGVQDGEDTLFIRRCRFQTRIYNVKLS